jgi:NADH-quinone oxidoreductase subunit J
MRLSSLTPTQLSGAQIALAVVLAVIGFLLLLPRPRGRFVPGGIAFLIAAISGLVVWLFSTFGKPMPDAVGTVLFILFSLGALGFGTVLVAQRNPARGAIAFAFVILSTCGLFLLLAAPFLMAATIIIYAGAIIVTFLFVLMLSQVQGPSDENDRSREPLFGGLAGFAFTGLVLFAVYLSAADSSAARAADPPPLRQLLPAPVLTNEERATLAAAIDKISAIDDHLKDEAARDVNLDHFESIWEAIKSVVGSNSRSESGSLRARLEKTPSRAGETIVPLRLDREAEAVLSQAKVVRQLNDRLHGLATNHFLEGRPGADAVRDVSRKLREEVLLLAGAGELPARNVANLGFSLYAERLLAVELAGTLLLVAAVGAVAIAQRRGSVA